MKNNQPINRNGLKKDSNALFNGDGSSYQNKQEAEQDKQQHVIEERVSPSPDTGEASNRKNGKQ